MEKKSSKTYQRVEAEAKVIVETRERMHRTNSQCVFEIGKQLLAANDKLAKHGEGTFIKWCRDRLELKKTTAYKWMRVADRYGDCPQCVQSIAPAALYRLTEPATPKVAWDQANKIAEQGGFVTFARAKDLISAALNFKRPVRKGNGESRLILLKACWKELGKNWYEASDDERREFNEWRTWDDAASWKTSDGVRYRSGGMTRERMQELAADDH